MDPSLSPHTHSLPVINVPIRWRVGHNHQPYTDTWLFTKVLGFRWGHSGCYVSYAFGHTYGDMDPPSQSLTRSISLVLEAPCAPTAQPSLTPGNHWSFRCLHNFPFSRLSQSWHPIGFSRLSICIQASCTSFRGLVACCFFSAEQYSLDWLGHTLSIHAPADGHLGSSQALAIVHKAATRIRVQVFVGMWVFSLFQ